MWGDVDDGLIQRVSKSIDALKPSKFKTALIGGLERYCTGEDYLSLYYLLMLKKFPVTMEEFLDSEHYLDMGDSLYPEIKKDLIELNNPDGDVLGLKHYEGVWTGGIGCLPGDAEFLSPEGWVRLDHYQGEHVAEYDPDTGEIDYKPSEYVEQPSEGWWEFEKGYFRKRVSPEHTILLKGRSGATKVTTAQELATACVNRHSYSIPHCFTPTTEGIDLTDSEVALMVAVVSDGNFREGRKDCRVTLRKPRKKIRLVNLLEVCGIEYRVSSAKNRPDEVAYVFQPPLRVKDWAWAWGANAEQLELIYQECPHWDGLHPDSSTDQEWRFHSTDRGAADFMQYLCHATGRRGVVRTLVREGRKDLYVIQARRSSGQGWRLDSSEVKWVEPHPGEKKYCFVTGTGFFIVRYQGSVMVTGNTGKTTQALCTTGYQVYLLSCFRDPHRVLQQDHSSEIYFIFQSLNGRVAKDVDYKRFRAMLERSPYFTAQFPFRRDLESRMIFPHRIEVLPVGGQVTATIGQNVYGGMMDEVNFMEVIENSKKKMDGSVFDQARELYSSLSSRRSSRFMLQGKMPGIFCLVSSKNYPGQFTDVKKTESEKDPGIWYFDKTVWEVKPAHTFSGKWFWVFVGDEARKPRILDDNEVDKWKEKEPGVIRKVPLEYRMKFEIDIYNALREIAGVSTLAQNPYLSNVELISDCFKDDIESPLSRDEVDFDKTTLTVDFSKFKNPEAPHYAHVDLGLTSDSAGVCLGHVSSFKELSAEGTKIKMPVVDIDFTLRVNPPKNGEINFAKIRKLLIMIKKKGINLKWISYDSFQSVDSMQILRAAGFTCGNVSLDRNTIPFDITKQAIEQGRIRAPKDNHLKRELVQLERTVKNGKIKIDHPPNGTKDVADSFAAVVYGLTSRRIIWRLHKVPVNQAIMGMVKDAKEDEKDVA